MLTGPVSHIAKMLFEYAVEVVRKNFNESDFFPPDIAKLKGLPDEPRTFDPFLSARKGKTDGGVGVWQRDGDVERLRAHLKEHTSTHLILTGPSGAGKTVFLTQIVKARYLGSFVEVSKYSNFLSTLISQIPCDRPDLIDRRTSLDNSLQAYIETAKPIFVGKVLQDRAALVKNDVVLAKITDEISQFITDAMATRPLTLFVFDQIERFLLDVKYKLAHASEDVLGYEIYFLIIALSTLRGLDNVRTVFSIRADALYASVDFLSYSLNDSSEADRIFRYMYFGGINIKDADRGVIAKIQLQFDDIADGILTWREVSNFLSLQSRSISNTFFIQLTGYLIEHFSDTDQRIKEVVKKPGDPGELLPIFFEQLLAGYHHRYPGTINYDVLRVIILTIAIENRSTGDPVTPDRISKLAHLPVNYVRPVVAYLLSIGVVRSDAKGDRAIRFAHDMLFDHIVQADGFIVRDDLQKAIERLSERRSRDLNAIEGYGRVLTDARDFDVGALAVLAFGLYGAVVCLTSWGVGGDAIKSSAVCDAIHGFWSWLFSTRVHVEECSALKWYYPAIFVADLAWISYMYKLDKGYFRNIFHGFGLLRRASTAVTIIAAVLGIAASFTPVLTVVPITVCGLLLAALLFVVRAVEGSDSQFSKSNKEWAYRTTLNMLFVNILIPLHLFMVTDTAVYRSAREAMDATLHLSTKNLTFWLTAIFLLWFWMHVRPDQQSEVSIATRLASRGPSRGRYVS
jgi:hypothetical protein